MRVFLSVEMRTKEGTTLHKMIRLNEKMPLPVE